MEQKENFSRSSESFFLHKAKHLIKETKKVTETEERYKHVYVGILVQLLVTSRRTHVIAEVLLVSSRSICNLISYSDLCK